MKFYKIKFGAVQTWDIFLFHIFKVTRAMLMKYPTFARVISFLWAFHSKNFLSNVFYVYLLRHSKHWHTTNLYSQPILEQHQNIGPKFNWIKKKGFSIFYFLFMNYLALYFFTFILFLFLKCVLAAVAHSPIFGGK